jgi:serine/threonine protein kinase
MAERISRTTPPSSVGRYEIFTAISREESGTTYRARDPETDGFVAVKLLNPELTSNAARFDHLRKEVATALQFDHPNILRALDSGLDGVTGYVVTELVEGNTLAQMIDAHKRLPEETAVRIVTQVGQALHYTHQKSGLCWEVEPENVVIRNDGVAKVIYPGLTHDTYQDPADRPRGLERTARFAAPESDEARKARELAACIYSLGAVLCLAVSGQILTFDATPRISRRTRRPKVETRYTRKLGPGVSEGIELAVRRTLDPDPAKRPQTILEFLKLLRARARSAGARKLDQRPGAAEADNRRSHVRYTFGVGGNCAINPLVCEPSVGRSKTDVHENWPLVVRDVSVGGIGILLARRFERGAEILIELPLGPNGSAYALPARVVRVKRETHGHWTLGCEFLKPLTDRELKWLLDQVVPAGESSTTVPIATPPR